MKGALSEGLDLMEFFTHGSEYQILDDLKRQLGPSTQNERFGSDVFLIIAALSGGGKTGRKVNLARYEINKEAVDLLRRIRDRLKATPNKDQCTFDAIKIVEGRLE